jgi:hypothetical protein
MSRRTAATIPRGRPHIPHEDPEAPGTCSTCHRPTGLPNDMHVDQLPDVDPAIAEAEARRYGEYQEYQED